MNGIKLGNYTDKENGTGVTVLLCEGGATCGVAVRGFAPGTRETDLLRSENSVQKVNAVVLSGGSALGLESMCGVSDYLREKNIGFGVGDNIVPIVVGAVIFDLSYKSNEFPNKMAGVQACENATSSNFSCGSVGVGTGATIGKLFGDNFASKGGMGIASIKVGEIEMLAVVCVNALGDVWDHKTNQIVAGAKMPDGKFFNLQQAILNGALLNFDASKLQGKNTSIGFVVTNAKLSKPECNKLASISHDGLALNIRPVHTDFDGDTMFALSVGDLACDFVTLQTMCVEAVSQAIVNAVI